MNTKLVFIGKLDNVFSVENDGKKAVVLQFLDRTESGKLKLIDVKATENLEKFEKLEPGKEVKLLVNVSTFNNKIYYKAIDLIK